MPFQPEYSMNQENKAEASTQNVYEKEEMLGKMSGPISEVSMCINSLNVDRKEWDAKNNVSLQYKWKHFLKHLIKQKTFWEGFYSCLYDANVIDKPKPTYSRPNH